MILTNLKGQIDHLKSANQAVQSRRHEEAESALMEGLAAFEIALENELRIPEQLKYACRKLIEAMRLNHRDERPCLALSFLFLSIEDTEMAREYLHHARQLDYNHPFALALEETLKSFQNESEKPSLNLPPIASDQTASEIDYDALYETVSDQIDIQIKWLSEQIPPEPSLQSERLKAYDKIINNLSCNRENLLNQISVVDREIETEELVVRLKPLEQRLKAYREVLAHSQKLTETHQDILTMIRVLEEKLPHLPMTGFSIDPILDQCDAVADILDTLESEGLPIESLLQNYQKLCEMAEEAADLQDDA